jgi:hypothetical protein
MQFSNSNFISYGGTPVKQIWSSDTLVWSASSFGWVLKNLAFGPWSEIAYGPTDTLVAAGANRYSYSTNNGDTWSVPVFNINPTAGSETYNTIAWNNDLWVMVEGLAYTPFGTTNFYTSVNILTGWTSYTLNPIFSAMQFSDCQYSSFHGRYVAVGSKDGRVTDVMAGMYSTDGTNWLSANYLQYNGTPLSDSFGFDGNVVEGFQMPNNRFVACGTSGNHKFGYSDNGGQTWRQGGYTAINSPLGQNLQSGHPWKQVAYGYDGNANLPLSGRYVAVSDSGSTSTYQFAYSNDGIGWYGVSYASPDLKRNWNSVVYGNGYFVALGVGYQALSKDGINWVAFANVSSTVGISDVTIANNRFVAVVSNDTVNNVGCSTADFIF